MGLGLLAILRAGTGDSATPNASIRALAAFASNVAVGTFHPKTIVFFVAFVPQFISAERAYAPQAAALVATFCITVACTDGFYALLASRASHSLRRPETVRWSRRAGGGVLIAAGLATAAARR